MNEEREEENTLAFDCPACGKTNLLKGKPEELKGCIFSCLRCGRKILMTGMRGSDE